jgi:hypothetical protein
MKRAKGGIKSKTLASQLIPKYIKFFKNKIKDAIDAQLDLCEEDDIQLRISAIKGLPGICEESAEDVGQIASVLGQLLERGNIIIKILEGYLKFKHLEERISIEAVKVSFSKVLIIDPLASIKALFQLNEKEDFEKILNFLSDKIITDLLEKKLLSPEIETLIFEEVKKVKK